MSSIEVSDLQLRRSARFALGPVSLSIASGDRVALVGPSGCGKTTLLRCLAGLERPDAGTIRIGDQVATDGKSIRLDPSARGLGVVFQDGALWPHLDAVGHLRFVAPDLDAAGARALLAEVGLHEHADRRPGSMSGGEQQRLAIARALAGKPRILLLDEPLHSVDVHLRDELCALITKLADEHGLTLIVVTHDRGEALALADEFIVLDAGKVVETGPAHEILEAPRSAFGARFLGGAACITLRVSPDGSVETPFGPLHDWEGESREFDLAVLPCDVSIVDAPEPTPPQPERTAKVVRAGPSLDGSGQWIATLELPGITFRAPCARGLRPGSEVQVRLETIRAFDRD